MPATGMGCTRAQSLQEHSPGPPGIQTQALQHGMLASWATLSHSTKPWPLRGSSPLGEGPIQSSSCRLHTPWRKASCLPVKCTGVVHDQAGCQEPRSHRLTACSHSQPMQVQAAARAGVPTGRAHLVKGAPREFWVGRPPPYQCLHVESVSGRRNPQRSVRPYRKQTIRPVGHAVLCTVAVS